MNAKRLFQKIAFGALVLMLCLATVRVVQANLPITYCHGTSAGHWNDITSDADSIFKQGHTGHADDVIPGFVYGDLGQYTYPGLNLATIFVTDTGNWTGQQILEEGCTAPRANTAVYVFVNECPGYAVGATASEGATITGEISGLWVLPHDLEGPIAGGTIHVSWTEGIPRSMDFPYSAFSEPASCNPTNTASYQLINDNCEIGWKIDVTASPNYDPFVEPSGVWTKPYEIEHVDAGSVTVTWAIGTPDHVTLDYNEITEPDKCLVTLPHDYTAVPVPSCKIWDWDIDVVKGTWAVKTGPMSGEWTDPYTLEPSGSPTITITWEDGYSEDVKIPSYTEPEECKVTLEHNFVITGDSDCDEWWQVDEPTSTDGGVGTAITPISGVWVDPYHTESVTITYSVTWPDKFTENRSTIIAKNAECIVDLEHTATIALDSNCVDWWTVGVTTSPRGNAVAITDTSGSWSKPHETESATVKYTVTWPDGYSDTFSATEVEHGNCNPDNWANATTPFTCQVWSVMINHSAGGTHADPPSGSWMKPFEEETIFGGSMTVYFETGSPAEVLVSWPDIVKPANCKIEECSFIKGIPATDPRCKVGACPECESRKEEIGGPNQLVYVQFAESDSKCRCNNIIKWLYIRTEKGFYAESSVVQPTDKTKPTPTASAEKTKGPVLTRFDPVVFVGLDKTYYTLQDKMDVLGSYYGGSLKFYNLDGTPWPAKDIVPFLGSCARNIGPWDVTPAGLFIKPEHGTNSWEAAWYWFTGLKIYETMKFAENDAAKAWLNGTFQLAIPGITK